MNARTTNFRKFLIACFMLATANLMLQTNSFAEIIVIEVGDDFFSPVNAEAEVGDTIRWVLLAGSMNPHTTTSRDIPDGAESWDEPIDNANTTFDYEVLHAGTYHYVCLPHEGMNMVGTIEVSEPDEPNRISETVRAFPAGMVYPNPAGLQLYVSIDPALRTNGKITLTDLAGRKHMQISAESEVGVLTIDTSGLKSGVYQLTFSSNEATFTEKVIIQ